MMEINIFMLISSQNNQTTKMNRPLAIVQDRLYN